MLNTKRDDLLSLSHSDDDSTDLSPDRRGVLQGFAGAAGLAGLGTLGSPSWTQGTFTRSTDDPVSMAMHIHASFSEGSASMEAHLAKARKLGVDVVWWTEHDFRQTAHGYRKAADFLGAHESEGPFDLSWEPHTYNNPTSSSHEFVDFPKSPQSDQPGALRIQSQAAASGTWSAYKLDAKAYNSTYSTSYVDTTLEFDVLAERLGSDARVVVEIVSSYRPATSTGPAGQYRLQYRIGGAASTRYERLEGGQLGVVNLPLGESSGWQTISMRLQQDHDALWPGTVSGDASLCLLRIGVMSRNGQAASAVVDRLRFHRTRQQVADPEAYSVDLVRDIVRKYRTRFPEIKQFTAAEVSLVLHLNAYGGDRTLPRYKNQYAVKDGSFAAQQAMVRFLHDHGAAVCLNHPLQGSGGANALAHRLITTRGVGADIIEVGTHRNNDSLIRVFDTAARNGVFLTANGSTDDHSSFSWESPSGWLTGVWSPVARRGSLCQALRAGRAWFYDPLYWKGSFDIQVDGQAPMGSVLFTGKRTLPVQVRASALPSDGTLELVTGVCDFAGPNRLSPRNISRAIPARKVTRDLWSTSVERGKGVYVRAVVRRSTGDIVGFSNPVWVLPKRLEGQVHVPSIRRAES